MPEEFEKIHAVKSELDLNFLSRKNNSITNKNCFSFYINTDLPQNHTSCLKSKSDLLKKNQKKNSNKQKIKTAWVKCRFKPLSKNTFIKWKIKALFPKNNWKLKAAASTQSLTDLKFFFNFTKLTKNPPLETNLW